MKAYIKVKKDYNSGLVVGHSQNMQKAISGFNELACEVVPYFSLDDVYNQIGITSRKRTHKIDKF